LNELIRTDPMDHIRFRVEIQKSNHFDFYREIFMTAGEIVLKLGKMWCRKPKYGQLYVY